MKTPSALKYDFEFRLRDGNSYLWFSNWPGVGKLAEQVLYVDIYDLKIWVNDAYLDENWNFNSLCINILLVYCKFLTALPICLNSLVLDRLIWKGKLYCIYTTQNGYNWLNRLEFVQNTIDITIGSGYGIFLLPRRWNSSFGRLYISPLLWDRCCVIVVCSRRISVLDAIRMLRRLYTSWEIVNLLLIFGNLLAS